MKNLTKALDDEQQSAEQINFQEELEKAEAAKKKAEKEAAKAEKAKQKAISKHPTAKNEKDELRVEIDEFKNFNPEPLEVKKEDSETPAIKAKIKINTELVLNIRKYNRYIDYLPSDFTVQMVKNIFILHNKMHLPKGAKVSVKLYPNDTEKTLKVIVAVDKFYKQGLLIHQNRMFDPFWIIGFGTYSLIVTNERPIENRYRVNNIHAFAYSQSQKMKNKRISPKNTNKSKSAFQVEEDFIRARDNKNWYLEQYVEGLNRIRNVEWECHPRINVNWATKNIKFDLYLKIDKMKDEIRKTKWVYVDSFTVKAARVLDIDKKTKIVDIDSIMYLVALNAIYKNIKIFSYQTLYESYKSLAAEMMSKGYRLKRISAQNLNTLKVVDFSTHFRCKNVIFNDSILHIMNLMSSHEDYYRMKYSYTVQKNPSLLFSDFIVKEFKTIKVNELSTIMKNQEEKYWMEQIKKLDELNNKSDTKNKDFYINNYNVLKLTGNVHKDVESFLMGVIKGEKDEITRISQLGQELLQIDEDPRFTKKESIELKKVAKKLDDNYKELFGSFDSKEMKKLSKVKPIKIKEKKSKNKKKKKDNHDAAVEQQVADQAQQQYAEQGYDQSYDAGAVAATGNEGVNNG